MKIYLLFYDIIYNKISMFENCVNLLKFKIPDEEDIYTWDRFTFEIIDIDGHQIDKVLVTDLGPQPEVEEG